jgi:hypothetical protein
MFKFKFDCFNWKYLFFYCYSSKNSETIPKKIQNPSITILQIPLWFELIPHTFHFIFTLLFTLLHLTSCQTIRVPTYKRGVPFWTWLRKFLPFLMSSSMHHRSNASSTLYPHDLFQPPPPQSSYPPSKAEPMMS